MSEIALAKPTWRINSSILAQILAIAFVASIPISNSITIILSILLPIACIAYMDKRTWQQALANHTSIAIIIFVALSLCASLYSIGASKDIILALRKNARFLYFIFLLPLFVQAKWRQYANIFFLISVSISVVAAIIYTWTFFKDPIFTSLFVSFAIFMCAHLCCDFKQYNKFTLPLAVFLTFYLFFIGTGRVGQLLFFVLMPLFIYQRVQFTWRNLWPFVMMLAVLCIAVVTLPSSFLLRQTKAIGEIKQYMHTPEAQVNHESSLGIRFTLAHNTWQLITQKPFWGWGSGAFRQAYAQHAFESSVKEVTRTNPHNQYLLTWLELGIPGLLVMLGLFVTLWRQFAAMHTIDGYLGMGLLVSIILGCTMNSWLLDVTSAFFFITMAAVYAAAGKTPIS